MKKIQYILLALAFVLPASVSAASFTFVPAFDSYTTGSTFVTSVFVNPSVGEKISATKVSLTFPKNELQVVSYNPVNGGNILAHIGTKTDNINGKIVDNVAFNPGITKATKIATITFKAKSAGQAKLAVASDSKILNSTSADKYTGSTGATYTLAVPTPTVTKTKKPKAFQAPKHTPKPSTFTNTVTPSVAKLADTKATESNSTTTKAGTITKSVKENSKSQQIAAAAAAKTGSGSKNNAMWYYILATLLVLIAGGLAWVTWGSKLQKNKDLM